MAKYIDICCKTGNALDYVLNRARGRGWPMPNSKNDKIGIDILEKYKADVERRGYCFKWQDVCACDMVWEDAWCYVAFDALEHLSSIEYVTSTVFKMQTHAEKAIWIKIPNFCQDMKTGEGVLKKLGLRFSWTNWTGHLSNPTPDVICACFPRELWNLDLRPIKMIDDTSYEYIIPDDAECDDILYQVDKHAKKEFVIFDQPLIGAWEMLFERK